MPVSTAIAAVHAIVFIVNLIGNTLVCVIIKRNQDMRYGKSLHSSQVAHPVGAYPGFCSMKRLGVFLLSPGWDASPSQG